MGFATPQKEGWAELEKRFDQRQRRQTMIKYFVIIVLLTGISTGVVLIWKVI